LAKAFLFHLFIITLTLQKAILLLIASFTLMSLALRLFLQGQERQQLWLRLLLSAFLLILRLSLDQMQASEKLVLPMVLTPRVKQVVNRLLLIVTEIFHTLPFHY